LQLKARIVVLKCLLSGTIEPIHKKTWLSLKPIHLAVFHFPYGIITLHMIAIPANVQSRRQCQWIDAMVIGVIKTKDRFLKRQLIVY